MLGPSLCSRKKSEYTPWATDIRQGMGIMHSSVMYTFFYSSDTRDTMPFSVQNELNIVWLLTGNFFMLI